MWEVTAVPKNTRTAPRLLHTQVSLVSPTSLKTLPGLPSLQLQLLRHLSIDWPTCPLVSSSQCPTGPVQR